MLNFPLFYTLTKTYIFSLSETHIDNSTPTQLLEISCYTLINKNRDVGTHGGVTVYIKDAIPFIRRTDLEINELECIWLEMNFPNTKSFLISVWYRPPSTSKFLLTTFNKLLRKSLIKVSSDNKETILTANFNLNYQKVDDNGELKSIFTLFQLKQKIKTATRVTGKTESLIDLVFTNVLFNITMNDVYAVSFSDHELIGFNRKQNRVKTAPKTIRCRNFRRYDHSKLKENLKNADWSPVYISHSISDYLQAVNRILREFFDRHAPFATKRTNTNIFDCIFLSCTVRVSE